METPLLFLTNLLVMRHFVFMRYHFNATSGMWVKSDHLVENKDEDIEGAFEDILTPEHVPSLEQAPSPASSSLTTQPSSKINGAILDAIHFLSNDV
ncbi:hypothetical protein J1N35_008255 [Gossypium stocksii]|uniref:Uncharacterized protein n=1 Tax=Gossypium stocksii TaxID=47602 RepID=A0A9D3W8H4_9ROSI|nr:hypothetical protein J1N35_008255 [Gossypium stocksii]